MARRKRRARIIGRKKTVRKVNRLRCCFIWGGSIAAALILLAILGLYWLVQWLQGDSFRESLADDLSSKTKAEVTIPANLRIDGSTFSLPEIQYKGTQILKKAAVSDITAEIVRSDLWNRYFHATHLAINSLDVQLDTLKEPPFPIKDDDDSSSFWKNFTPNTFGIDKVECAKANAKLTFRRSDKKKSPGIYSISGTTFTAVPLDGNIDKWQLHLQDGTLATSHSYLAKCSIRQADVVYADGVISLKDGQLALNRGNMNAEGSFDTQNKKWNASLSVGNADIHRLLASESLKNNLVGEFSADFSISGKRRVIHKASGDFSLKKGQFKALSYIMAYLGSKDRKDLAMRFPHQQAALDYVEKKFKLVKINKADFQITFPYSNAYIKNAWLFDNIVIHAMEDNLRIQGHVIIEQDSRLHGSLHIGLRKAIISEFIGQLAGDGIQEKANLLLQHLFKDDADADFIRITINLSGTTSAPQEDFTPRIKRLTELGTTLRAAKDLLGKGMGILTDKKEQEPTPDAPSAETETTSPAPGLLDTAEKVYTDGINTGKQLIPLPF